MTPVSILHLSASLRPARAVRFGCQRAAREIAHAVLFLISNESFQKRTVFLDAGHMANVARS
jgi:hypothetical protein